MKIITEEMRFRKRLCEFALKYGVTKAAKRYHTNRQFVYRQLEIVDEKSVTNTSKFIRTLEEKMGLKINTIQTDNGPEFVNNQIETNLPTLFELTLKDLGMIHRRTRPYSPWQNGKVERSHKIDGERFYSRNEFTSEEDLKKKLKRYNARYNNIAKKVLDFKSPNQIVEEYKLNFLSA